MKNNTTTVLVAAGALLVGGVAMAAFMNNRDKGEDFVTPTAEVRPELDNSQAADDAASAAVGGGKLEYVDVLKIDPVTTREKLYATVTGTDPIRETSTTTTPHEVCKDVVVQERQAERDGNVGGTVVGAVVGGLIGNQFGSGSGRKLATAAGAVAGGAVGNRVDRQHVGGQVVNRTERQCHTEKVSSNSSRVVGYTVTYRNADGTTGSKRMDSKPGDRIEMGDTDNVVGYDVTYRYEGADKTIRLKDKPASNRLPVVDGQLVTQTAAVAEPSNQQ